MGFREDGSCSFLAGSSCSIYAHRPQTCRDYDCRIYAAAGLLPDGNWPVIAERVRAWKFGVPAARDVAAARAVRRAAHFIRGNAGLFPPAIRAGSATAAAVLAVKSYELFLDATDGESFVSPSVQGVIDAVEAFNREVIDGCSE